MQGAIKVQMYNPQQIQDDTIFTHTALVFAVHSDRFSEGVNQEVRVIMMYRVARANMM